MENALAKNEPKALEVINPAIAKAAESAGIMEAIGQEVSLLPTVEAFRYRLPRLGKIRIGIKVNGTTKQGKEFERPQAVDYFVLPEILLNDKEFIQALVERGIDPEKPKALPIMLLRNAIGEDVISSYDLYGKSKGLICRSYDHVTCQKVNSKTLEMVSIPCAGTECPDFKAKTCKAITRLRFMIPDAKGIGVWQLDTSSKNSLTNMLTDMMSIKQMMGGKLAGIDLLLTLEAEVKHIPTTDFQGNIKRDDAGNATIAPTTIHVVHVRCDVSMRKLQAAAAASHEFEGAEAVDMNAEEEVQIEYNAETGEVVENDRQDGKPEPAAENGSQVNTKNDSQSEENQEEPIDAEIVDEPADLCDELREAVTAKLGMLSKPLQGPFIMMILNGKYLIKDLTADQLVVLNEALDAKLAESK